MPSAAPNIWNLRFERPAFRHASFFPGKVQLMKACDPNSDTQFPSFQQRQNLNHGLSCLFTYLLCSSDVRIWEIRIEEMDKLRLDWISSSNHHHTQRNTKRVFCTLKATQVYNDKLEKRKRHVFRFLKGNSSWSHLWREAGRQMAFVGTRERGEVRIKKILACKDSSYTSTSVNHTANINTLRPASESSGGIGTSGIAAAGAGSWTVVISNAFLFSGLLIFRLQLTYRSVQEVNR